MSPVLIIVLVVVVIGVIVLFATVPLAKKREELATEKARQALGGSDAIVMMDTRATGMGFEPEHVSKVRAMSVLGASDKELIAVTWGNQEEWRINRSQITEVGCEAEDPAAVPKASVLIGYKDGSEEVVAKFRVKDPVPWLTELGYDWGPDGPPVLEDDDDEDDDEDDD